MTVHAADGKDHDGAESLSAASRYLNLVADVL